MVGSASPPVAPAEGHRVAFGPALFDDALPAGEMAHVVLDHGPSAPSRGRRPDLDAHMDMLAREFSGQSLLAFRHAWLIVRIRRDEDRERALAEFRALWDDDAALLIPRLDLRWLVSAADTFLAHPRDAAEANAGLAGTLAANIVKIYETERLSTGQREGLKAGPSSADALFDGMTAFSVGRGDMLANLVERVRRNTGERGAERLARAILDRLMGADTGLRRAAMVHASPSTRPAFRPRKVALFNDTGSSRDLGAAGVTSALAGMLARCNAEVIFRHRSGEDWTRSRSARAAIGKADLVLVNGDGAPGPKGAAAEALGAIGRAAAEASVRSALVNASFPADDAATLRALACFDHVWARESATAAALGAAGIDGRLCPDLTFGLPARAGPAAPGNGQLFVDAASPGAQRRLAALARAEGQPLLTLTRHRFLAQILGVPASRLGDIVEGRTEIGAASRALLRCGDHDAFRDLVGRAGGVTAGRFHAVCVAVLERTPFLAIPAEGAGIGTLLRDIGLDEARLFTQAEDWRPPPPFDDAELASIDTYLRRAEAARDRMAFELFGR